ncbi:transcriptional regulator [Bacillus licheniformis]|nr:transcriptional regulator [Bacillus licheniformis]
MADHHEHALNPKSSKGKEQITNRLKRIEGQVRGIQKMIEKTAYIACKPEVEAAGATYVEEKLHVDANLVSGHDWSNLPEFMREFFKALNK